MQIHFVLMTFNTILQHKMFSLQAGLTSEKLCLKPKVQIKSTFHLASKLRPAMPVIRFPGLCSLCFSTVILVKPKLSSKTNSHRPYKIAKRDMFPFRAAGFCIHVGNKDLNRH